MHMDVKLFGMTSCCDALAEPCRYTSSTVSAVVQSGLFTAGEVVLYTWTEWLKEQQHLWAPAPEIEHLPSVLVDSDAELAAQLQQVCNLPALATNG